jgi:hypothetical protein
MPRSKSQYAPLSVYVRFFRPRQHSAIQITEANSMTTVAAHVMPKNLLPLYAAMPISAPYLFTALTDLTMTAVEMAEAMPRVRNASCLLLACREESQVRARLVTYFPDALPDNRGRARRVIFPTAVEIR